MPACHRFQSFLVILPLLTVFFVTSATAGERDRVLDVNANEVAEMQAGLRDGDPADFGLLAMSDAQAEELSPLMQEIRGALLDEQAAVERLRAQVGTASANRDGARVLELQREIETVRRQAEARVVRIQIRHAEERGDGDTVTALRAELERLERDRIVGQPARRPAPRR